VTLGQELSMVSPERVPGTLSRAHRSEKRSSVKPPLEIGTPGSHGPAYLKRQGLAKFSTNAEWKSTGRNAIGLRSNDCSAKAVYQARPRRLPTKSLCARGDWRVGSRRRIRRDLRLSGRGFAQQCRQAIRPDDPMIASKSVYQARPREAAQARPREAAWRGVLTNPARTGLSSTYRAAVSKEGSSRTNEANLPCQRCPRQASRKLTILVYRRRASPIARRSPPADCGTAIRCT
jgi:hypothetical protein